ncbi:hypothetical protein DPMN_011776 [Dreissena polymorpha]|uniref:Uncharacterized protein n=1 Tax=Dreissena polymorpha TaxID=45954 RepID=A0A9D4N6S7_DREPO|nr:hypothetical protein DPMN_011776 [Dreissena polymorpha]
MQKNEKNLQSHQNLQAHLQSGRMQTLKKEVHQTKLGKQAEIITTTYVEHMKNECWLWKNKNWT